MSEENKDKNEYDDGNQTRLKCSGCGKITYQQEYYQKHCRYTGMTFPTEEGKNGMHECYGKMYPVAQRKTIIEKKWI